ncbi:MAG: histidine phosphatase family protein [Gammaproteobacteria bacterium]|nr:histidine phosphatase family protein [Gammaproteobacteria bacterium]
MSSRHLLLLRHGKSDWHSDAKSDFDRPLNTRGKKAVKSMCRWMTAQGIRPDWIVSSPATRARQTTLRLCKELQVDGSTVFWEPSVYEADLNSLFQVLAQCPTEESTVMLIGHNPGLEALVRYLAGPQLEDSTDNKLLPTAALAQFEMPEDWAQLYPGSGRNLLITRPRDLRGE